MTYTDVAPHFVWNEVDAAIGAELVKREATPAAIRYFARHCSKLTDYAYWFYLGTLWVSYTGWSSLTLWRRLFRSTRPYRMESLMKPSELAAYEALPDEVRVFRAHRPDEEDWMSYTLSISTAIKFVRMRGTNEVTEYTVRKRDIVALFFRRGEYEVLVLDTDSADFIADHKVVAMYV